MSQKCKRLHELVHQLPQTRWPFDPKQLPRNGIYFFIEQGEAWGHGGERPRIVRVGTHREGNFRSRMADHYVADKRMLFDASRPGPKERSVFRKNIGRAILHRDRDAYDTIWELDFTPHAKRRGRCVTSRRRKPSSAR